MKTTGRVLAVLAAVLMMSVAAPAQEQAPSQQPPAAQQPAPAPDRQQPAPAQKDPAPAEAPAVRTVQGELSSVDADAKTLEIKTADGSMMKFSYTDDTEVTGAKEEGVAGLATSSGSRVTIDFTEDGDSKIATKIKVEAKS